MKVVPRAGGSSLEVTVGDGTGEATAVFTGRRRIRGSTPAGAWCWRAWPASDHGRTLLMNPAYTLLP